MLVSWTVVIVWDGHCDFHLNKCAEYDANIFKHSFAEGVRLGFYGAGDPAAQQLAEEVDERLFRGVRYIDEQYVLQHLFPDIISHRYSLRPRQHNFVLTTKTDQRNVIVRQLFSDIYWYCSFVFIVSFPHCNQSRSARLKLKRLIDWLID